MLSRLVDFSQMNGLLPTISTVIFFTIFMVVLVWTIFLDKKYIKRMEELPLEGDDNHGQSH